MQIMHIWSILDAHIYMLVHFLAYICKIACCIFKYVPIFAYLRIWIADDCRWLHISVGSNPAGPVAGCSCSIPASPAVTESRIFSASPIIWLSDLSWSLKQAVGLPLASEDRAHCPPGRGLLVIPGLASLQSWRTAPILLLPCQSLPGSELGQEDYAETSRFATILVLWSGFRWSWRGFIARFNT